MSVNRLFRFLGSALILAIAVLAINQMNTVAQTPDPEQLQLGQRLFAENCAVCHGPNGEGRVGAVLAKNWPSIRPALTVRNIIENGVPGSVMPAWSQANGGPLNSDEISALVLYILSWQTGGAPNLTPAPTYTPYPPITPIPNINGDPNQGATLFAENCAVCHGPEAQGRIGVNLTKNWPGIRPDLEIATIIKNGVDGSVMPAWGQSNGGPLSEENVNDLVAFILSRPKNTIQQITATPPPFAQTEAPWLRGWAGVLLFFAIFVVIIAGSLILQRRG